MTTGSAGAPYQAALQRPLDLLDAIALDHVARAHRGARDRHPLAGAIDHEVLGTDPSATPTFEQVPKLRYLRRVVDETLRLWPTAPGFARSPRETTTIGADGSAGVPGGLRMTPEDRVLVFIPLLHRDPQVWPDPERFDPDRFLPEHIRARPAHAYKPFGTGERACIGRQFALHESVIVLAKLLHRFDLTPEPGYELTITERLTLMPVGFRVGLTRR